MLKFAVLGLQCSHFECIYNIREEDEFSLKHSYHGQR